ncbi:Laminin subunit alpha-2 [Frankliniella fusca]|uniref:Laminin subunit alpha-2 n=1 Tax=Frankliniella fusca TaxID=407009 RepID=A0AAE1HWC3_9NEOP|nr:Laminin subunit alpha-2 [Frankliniella fusca]
MPTHSSLASQYPSTPAHGGHGHGHGPGAAFPSITEAAESWKKSLRVSGSGDGPGPGPTAPLHNSNLLRQRHHRSLQSLSTRPTSRDSYPHTPTPSPEDLNLLRPQNLNRYLLDHAKEFNSDHDDLDSLRSYGSNCSTQSACDHAQFGRNGTTFSGRRMKYIVHCSSHPEPNEYLTPTQRANQQIRRLKALLEQARKDIEMKDENIFKLTKEIVDLKLPREEVDGSPSKTTGTSENSTVFRVTTHLENECSNSLSDSGHFDDVLSVTSPQPTHSPGPRQLGLTPESERQAEIYQRKIDDVNRKHGEKSIEDRKSLVDMYEKKMEEMSKRASESLKKEKNDLIEMYEKRIEDIVRRHQDKIKEEKAILQESYQKQIEVLSQKNEGLHSPVHEKRNQLEGKKLEEVQKLLEISENKVTLLQNQLDEANARLSDLQQELFQSRESAVLLEEDVENLQRKILAQEQQLSEKNIALVQTARLESEMQVLRRHMEEQEESSEQTSQLQDELAKAESQLQALEIKYKLLESEKEEKESQFHERLEVVLGEKSQLENEFSRIMQRFKEIEKKSELLEEEKQLLSEEYQKLVEIKSRTESQFDEVSNQLKCLEQTMRKLESEKEKLEIMYKEEEGKVQHLKLKLERESDQVKQFLEEAQNKQESESNNAEIILLKEEECKRVTQLVSQFERDLADVRENLNQELKIKSELETWKLSAQEQISDFLKQVADLTENTEYLKKEISELKISLDERCRNQEAQDSIIEDLNETLNSSQGQVKEQQNELHHLYEQIAVYQNEIKVVSGLLEIEKNKNDELLQWKSQAEKLEREILCIKQNLDAKTQQLQYFAGIEKEVTGLKQSLALEGEKVQELLTWKSKAQNLEEELKSLREDMAAPKHTMHPVNATSEDVQSEATNESLLQQLPKQNQLNVENPVISSVSNEAQQYILELETVILKLQESLLCSYWNQSETDILTLETESTAAEQALKLVVALNQCIAKLKEENDELITLRNQHLQNSLNSSLQDQASQIADQSQSDELSSTFAQNGKLGLEDVSLHNGTETENAEDIVTQLKMEIESLRKALSDQEERHNEMNLKMYLKGQEAAKFERKDQLLEMAVQSPEKVSIPELLTQLADTEKELEKVKDNQLENMPKCSPSLLSASEAVCLYLLGSFKAMYRQLAEGQANSSSSPEATLLFLKSAVYYFLTDEANCQGHLHAIQSILGFTEAEKQSIDTLTYIRR